MKTRSQTKKEKLTKANEARKIPQLNEDVLGIILDYVVAKEQSRILRTINTIQNHCKETIDRKGQFYWSFDSPTYETSHTVHWPDHLDSNSRRLIHHTKVKLFPNFHLTMDERLKFHIASKQELDFLWQSMKNCGSVCFHWRDIHKRITPAKYFKELWDKIQAQRSLIEHLEEKLKTKDLHE